VVYKGAEMTKAGYKSDFKGVQIVLSANQRWVFRSEKQPGQELIVWTNKVGELFSQSKLLFVGGKE
jgi:hypothetical protein